MMPECLISSARLHSSPAANARGRYDRAVRLVQVQHTSGRVVCLLSEPMDHETRLRVCHMVAAYHKSFSTG